LAGVGIGGAIVAGTFGYHYWQFASTHQSTDNATVTGNIHQISSRISGTVNQVLVDDNQTVTVGQPLLKLDPRDYQIKLQQAQADLESARRKANTAQVNIDLASKNAQAASTQAQGGVGGAVAAIASAQAQVSEAQSGIPQAQAQVAQADANLRKAQSDLARFQQLFKEGAIARRDLDTAQQGYAVARAQKAGADQGVAQAQAKLAQAQQGIATAQAGLNSSQGNVLLKAMCKRHKPKAFKPMLAAVTIRPHSQRLTRRRLLSKMQPFSFLTRILRLRWQVASVAKPFKWVNRFSLVTR